MAWDSETVPTRGASDSAEDCRCCTAPEASVAGEAGRCHRPSPRPTNSPAAATAATAILVTRRIGPVLLEDGAERPAARPTAPTLRSICLCVRTGIDGG